MNATQRLHDLGQSLWLDNITRALLTSGTLARYIKDFAITGLTSNPTIFEHAIGESDSYDDAIHRQAGAGASGEALFLELALEDLTQYCSFNDFPVTMRSPNRRSETWRGRKRYWARAHD